jgi:1-acyl-sn-glycerol-3-phosphate acyltransferase
MLKILQIIYTTWCICWFLLIFLVLFPFMFLFLQRKKWIPLAHKMIRIWGIGFFFMSCIRIKITKEFTPDPQGVYVIVANHFSYLDVACMGVVVDNYFAFFGKSSVKKIPLLGYVFAKLHIQVDRSDKWSRSKSLVRGMKAIENGRSICIMPEGGIICNDFPNMHLPLKDGAFMMAIEKQVPILPVSLLNNYKIMPEILMKPITLRAIIHQPIATKGMTKEDIEFLKKQVYDTIQPALNNYAKVGY